MNNELKTTGQESNLLVDKDFEKYIVPGEFLEGESGKVPVLNWDQIWLDLWRVKSEEMAKKFYYVHDYESAEDLQDEIFMQVFKGADGKSDSLNNRWSISYEKSKKNVNYFIYTSIWAYLQDRWTDLGSEKKKFEREQLWYHVPLEETVRGENEDEDVRGMVEDVIIPAFDNAKSDEQKLELKDFLDRLDPELRGILHTIDLYRAMYPNDLEEVYKRVAEYTGKDIRTVLKKLRNNRQILDYFSNFLGDYSGGKQSDYENVAVAGIFSGLITDSGKQLFFE